MAIERMYIEKYPVLKFFEYDHLPSYLRDLSKTFAELAERCVRQCNDPLETSVALRKLLEAKDAAIRAALL